MTTMANNTDQQIATVDDVIAYLYDALRNMRDSPLEGDFEEGYERAFNNVMYHLLACKTDPGPDPTYH
jgi:hypothetical protein